MIFETYWIIAQNGDFWLPKRLKSGLHLVEVNIGDKEVSIKGLGAVRGKMITRNRWESLTKTPYSGQSFGAALQTLRGRDDTEKAAACAIQPQKPELPDNPARRRKVAARPRKASAGKSYPRRSS